MSLAGWTKQQKLAIETRHRDILVTASAGTGKTAVLSERCVNILKDLDEPVDVSQILVLTFTEAAAEEMKSRISKKLRIAARQSNDPYLKSQVLRLDSAPISTIHSFCKRLIQDNFYKLDIDPAFKVIDSDESRLLKKETLKEVIDTAWMDNDIADGMKRLASRRNLPDFWNEIINVSNFLEGIVSRQKWYRSASELIDISPAGNKNLVELQKNYFLPVLEDCLDMLRHSYILDRQLANGRILSKQLQEEYAPAIKKLISSVARGRLDNFADTLQNMALNPLKRKPNDITKEASDTIKSPAKKALDKLKRLREHSFLNPDYMNANYPQLSIQSKTFIEIIKRFDKQYRKVKSSLRCLDFADLEHRALELLADNPDTADNIRSRFKHVFVDEYQDINAVQKEIIRHVTGKGRLFVVGDIKQSIYAFRQSDPQIFRDHLAAATDDIHLTDKPLRVDLRDNFRSRSQILDFTNMIFRRIMKSSTASIDYDTRSELKSGLDYKSLDEVSREKKPAVELVIMDDKTITEDTPQDSSPTSRCERQAAWISERIKKMVNPEGTAEFKVYDKQVDSYRDVRYGDIVILMRSVSNRANEYTKILRLAGIPVSSQSPEGYFAQTEISDIVCLLKVLDNPQRDIEFASVLKSPLFRVTDSQLAHIRIHIDNRQSGNLNFYQSVIDYIHSGQDKTLAKMLREILDTLSKWRRCATASKLADLIWEIYQSTGYLAHVCALPGGTQRKANLLKLHDRAVQFEKMTSSNQPASLRRFVEFIEQLLDQDQDWSPANADSSVENAVRIMTIHRSKGLEFPVVFLAELGGRFNNRDLKGPCLYDKDLTVGMQVIDPEHNTKTNSPLYEMIRQKRKLTNLAEEMRILYVALTRPMERIVICASQERKHCRNILRQAAHGDTLIRDYQVKNVNGHFDWILLALADQESLLEEFDIDSSKANNSDLFSATVIERGKLDQLADGLIKKGRLSKKKLPSSKKTPSEIKKKYRRLLASVTRQYPYHQAVNLRSKHSVSQLSHNDDEFAVSNLSAAFSRRPLFVEGNHKDPSRKDIGSATHLVMEKIDLAGPVNLQKIQQTIEQLHERNRFSSRLIKYIDMNSIVNFFKSDPGRLASDPDNTVWREWPFTLCIDASCIKPDVRDDKIIVQGIIDMVIKTQKGLVIIDFKTDLVKNEKQAAERAKIYSEQIRYYCRAAEKILKTKVQSAFLYFLNLSMPLEIRI